MLSIFRRNKPQPPEQTPVLRPAAEDVDLAPTRRQGSQANLNRYFAQQQPGLASALRNEERRLDDRSVRGGTQGGPQGGQQGPPQSRGPLRAGVPSEQGSPPAAGAPSERSPHAAPQGGGSSAPQVGAHSASQQPLQQQMGGDAPLSRPMRERRRSMTLSELSAAAGPSLHVSQAALIMMPARLRQEQAAQSYDSWQPPRQDPAAAGGGSLGQLPNLSRQSVPAAPGSAASFGGVDPYSSQSANTPGGNPPGGGSREMYDRQPSIIREAVKQHNGPPSSMQQQQQQQQPYLQQPYAPPQQLLRPASELMTQPPERYAATPPRKERRASSLYLNGLPPNTQPQAHPGPAAGSSHNSMNSLAGQATAPGGVAAPGLQPHAPPGSARGSDPGDAFRRTAVTYTPAAVQPSDQARGVNTNTNRSWGSTSAEEAGGGGASSAAAAMASAAAAAAAAAAAGGGYGGYGTYGSKDQRAGAAVMPSRGDAAAAFEAALGYDRPGSAQHMVPDTRLPVIGAPRVAPNRAAASGHVGVNGGDADAPMRGSYSGAAGPGPGAGPVLGGGGAGGRSVDVAALTEAMAAAQQEAGRLRASALRKVDPRITRAVMERRMGPEDDRGNAKYDSGGLTPSLRSGAAANKRSPAPPSLNGRGAPLRPESPGPGAGNGSDAVSRARARLQEAESEAYDELSYMRRGSATGMRVNAEQLYAQR